jgi:heparan-sulfate lyase
MNPEKTVMNAKPENANGFGPAGGWTVKFHSLSPDEVLGKLDLDVPELAMVRQAAATGDQAAALQALLAYYQSKYPLQDDSMSDETPGAHTKSSGKGTTDDLSEVIKTADALTQHIFQWGPYPPAAYGPDIDWAWDPANDIEWVAAIYRFYWAKPLEIAYLATGDEKYAQTFVDLTADWIAKHPLEENEKTHPVYTEWRGFAWLDLQTGIRATNLCQAFRTMVHAEAFTPSFLAIFLASMYDHQVKTEKLPMGKIHNKAIFEQRGFINIAYTFPEFKERQAWLTLAMERTNENFLAQSTSDGVQREWSGGYHLGVLADAIEIRSRMETFGIPVPDAFNQRIRSMYDYIYGIASPDLGFPMFGDTARPLVESPDRSTWPLYGALMEASELLGEPKYAARAQLDEANLPPPESHAFREAGMYALRNGWGTEDIQLTLHCSPPAITSHDQPDNGTFELYAYGRWLMPDSGFYTYGNDKVARAWHRQTRVHQTLTLDGQDSREAPQQLLWHTEPAFDAVVVENQSYPQLAHRRTIWFVNKSTRGRSFFVLLDEALGDAAGQIDLHVQFAPGELQFDSASGQANTTFPDANLLVVTDPAVLALAEQSDGWFAWQYGSRQPRTAIRYQHLLGAPAAFLTLLVPYIGTEVPAAEVGLPPDFVIGDAHVTLSVSVFGERWEVQRDLTQGSASVSKTG